MSQQQEQKAQTENQSVEFTKHAKIAKVDSDRNVVVGICMEANKVDSQGDFESPDTIRRLSEDYMERLATGKARSGVMHAVFPAQDTLVHVENRVLSEPTKIGDTEYPRGSWVVGVKVRDETLRSLINSGTLSGFSIGGIVHDTQTYAVDELPEDVTIDGELREAAEDNDVPIREITAATIREISLVDFPAVQGAQIQTAKGDGIEKTAPELTEGVDAAAEYLIEERGHEEAVAYDLARFLNRKKSADDGGWLTRAKKFFTGSSGDGEDEEKAGRTLSESNVQSAMAVHDASIDLLNRSDVDHGRVRFSDDPFRDFDVGSYGAQKVQQSDELAESSADSITESMDKDDLKSLIEEVVDEKMADEEEQTEEKADDDPSDLEEIKAQLSDLQEAMSEPEETEEKSEEDDELGEIKEMLGQIASAQGVSQQADNGQAHTEKDVWGNSPFAAGGD